MNLKPSHLFYQGRERKPVLDQARGVYMWDVDGKRYLDGSSGAMVCNIGHSNENVLEAMRRQMEKSTFLWSSGTWALVTHLVVHTATFCTATTPSSCFQWTTEPSSAFSTSSSHAG